MTSWLIINQYNRLGSHPNLLSFTKIIFVDYHVDTELLKYGLRDDQPIHISEVPSGLKCNCNCPQCGSPLIARKGSQREHHFAHHGPSSCKHATETALHLVAKKAIEKSSAIRLPAVLVTFSTYLASAIPIADESTYQIDSIKLEKRIGDIVPDLIATIQGRDLLIEIFVTHHVDEQKRNKIARLGISAIEIDLSAAPRDLDFNSVYELVVNGVKNKKWIYNVKKEKEYKRIMSQTIRKPSIPSGFTLHVDLCPINARVWHGRPYANVIDDCQYCEHCLNLGYNMNHVDCNGHHKKQTHSDF